ncbi:MAG: hypothetical protein JW863_02185 [Chitinispirillaceae bacterium]|nr:hypothetical protein [Chitinispirillaceae bacterium]
MFRCFRVVLLVSVFTTVLTTRCTPSSPAAVSPQAEEYTCTWNGTDSVTWFDSISCPDEFAVLAGPPIMQTLSNERSVKVVYEIATGRTYFVSSAGYQLHYDFCREELGYPRSHADFNNEQYAESALRLYYLASVNYFGDAKLFTLQFFSDDRIMAAGISTMFTAVKELTFFGDELRLLVSSTSLAEQAAQLPDVPLITNGELYGRQQFQALNPAEACGYLRKVPYDEVATAYLGRHDIVVVNGIPIDLPVVAGIITTEFQTPLSHINVLSHNRGTPNMALANAWSDSRLAGLWDRLVYFRVRADTFEIRAVSIDSAEAFWNAREPQQGITLACDDSTEGLFSFDELDFYSAVTVGAKAANVAVVSRIIVGDTTIPVPEGGFAIPFFYYRHHMKTSGGDDRLRELLADGRFREDAAYRERELEGLRELILDAPLDDAFVELVKENIRSTGNYPAVRFRSSTNVEDIEGFNGAGLYDSYTAEPGSDDRSVEGAIKKVYASLWTLRGFEERDYFRIDHVSCAMGILVHRAFTGEQANGVAITANIYQPYVPAMTINAQIQEISVVRPPAGFRSDQLLVYTLWPDWLEKPAIEYLTYSNVNFGEPVLADEEVLELARCLAQIKQEFVIRYRPPDTYRFGMDVEFKFDGPERTLYIKQARPYTVESAW